MIAVPRFVSVRKELRRHMPDPGALYWFDAAPQRVWSTVVTIASIALMVTAAAGIALAVLWRVFIA